MNKQPFYHEAVILFTATQEIDRDKLEEILCAKLGTDGIIVASIQVEEVTVEAGDPHDLMET